MTKCDIVNSTISFQNEVSSWVLPISEIKLVGEYILECAPYLDDYFIVFLNHSLVQFEMPIYIFEKIQQELSVKLGCQLRTKLLYEKNFSSRIMYPNNLIGHPVWVSKLKKSLFERHLNLDIHTEELEINKEMIHYLKRG